MSRRKDWTELGERSQAQYQRTLERAFGKKVPGFVPDYSKWPESSRSILRAALQAYWANRDDEAKGILLAKKIKKAHKTERVKVWPSPKEAELWLKTAEQTEPRGAFLIVKICFKRGMRAEEVLSTPRPVWQAAVQYGRLKFVGKGDKERVLMTTNLRSTIQELLDMPASRPHNKSEAEKAGSQRWNVPGEILAKVGSTLDTQRHMLTRYMRRVAVTAGLDPTLWHPHTLRHVFASRYTGSIHELQLALGHVSLETTIIYTHPTPENVGKHFEGD